MIDEPDADVHGTRFCPATATGWARSRAKVTIQDDDTLPGAPSISSVTVAATEFTVAWSAPADPGYSDGTDLSHTNNTVTAYDVRYILSSAADKSDDQWTVVDDAVTVGNLQYTAGSLAANQSYDVQVRAVTQAGDGSWSAAAMSIDTTAPVLSATTPPSVTGAALVH